MLTDKQKEAVRLLCIESKGVGETAAILGVHRTTIWRWKCTKDFAREWDRQLKAYIRQWRKDQGFTKKRAERRKKTRELERKMASIEVVNGDTRALDKAYDEWRRTVWEELKNVF